MTASLFFIIIIPSLQPWRNPCTALRLVVCLCPRTSTGGLDSAAAGSSMSSAGGMAWSMITPSSSPVGEVDDQAPVLPLDPVRGAVVLEASHLLLVLLCLGHLPGLPCPLGAQAPACRVAPPKSLDEGGFFLYIINEPYSLSGRKSHAPARHCRLHPSSAARGSTAASQGRDRGSGPARAPARSEAPLL